MWDPGPATIWETIDTKLKERNEGEFITVSEESECDEKDKDASRESDACEKHLIKWPHRDISWSWKCRGWNLEADPNLERTIIIHQDIEKWRVFTVIYGIRS